MTAPNHHRLNVSPGTLYAGTNTRAGGRCGCTYRVLGVAYDVRAHREVCVWEGVDGADAGRVFVGPAAVLAGKMVPVEDDGEGDGQRVAAPPPAGVVREGDVPPAVVPLVSQGNDVDLTTKGSGLCSRRGIRDSPQSLRGQRLARADG